MGQRPCVALCRVDSGQWADQGQFQFETLSYHHSTAAIPGPLGHCASSPVGRGEAQVPARLHGGHILHRGQQSVEIRHFDIDTKINI